MIMLFTDQPNPFIDKARSILLRKILGNASELSIVLLRARDEFYGELESVP